jgi:hypothetical protein
MAAAPTKTPAASRKSRFIIIHPCSGTRPSRNTRTKASRVEPPQIEFGEALVSTRSGALLARLGRRAFPPRGPLVGVDLSRPDLGGKAVRDESPEGVSPPGAPRTVHDPLESHGSRCSAVAMA